MRLLQDNGPASVIMLREQIKPPFRVYLNTDLIRNVMNNLQKRGIVFKDGNRYALTGMYKKL